MIVHTFRTFRAPCHQNMAIACFMVRRVYARQMQAKPRVLRPGDLAHRPSKLKVSSTLSTSTPFGPVALPQQPSLLVRTTSYSASSHQKPQRRRLSQVQRSSPNKRIYVTYVWWITYLTFETDTRLPSFGIGRRPTHTLVGTLGDSSRGSKVYRKRTGCIHIRLLAPSPLVNTLQS